MSNKDKSPYYNRKNLSKDNREIKPTSEHVKTDNIYLNNFQTKELDRNFKNYHQNLIILDSKNKNNQDNSDKNITIDHKNIHSNNNVDSKFLNEFIEKIFKSKNFETKIEEFFNNSNILKEIRSDFNNYKKKIEEINSNINFMKK
jgi:hypothetical protein